MTQTENHACSPIGLYRANFISTDRLLATSIGRTELVEDMLEKLRRRGSKKSGQHMLLIGPRGIGKTHILSLLEHHIVEDQALSRRYHIIRFPEENNRLLSFADLLLGITEIIAETTSEQSWIDLFDELQEEEQDVVIIDRLLPRLKHYCNKEDRVLLLMLENLDTILIQQFKQKRDIHHLRSFLMDHPHILLIGTSPIFFPGINDVRHPLYDFFDIQVIPDLDQEQVIELVRRNLEADKQHKVLEHFSELVPRLRAIHLMTGGNPRLITMLYQLIGHERLLEVRAQFHKLLDTISPFYQDRIKELPPQERALLETLALMRTEPRTPKRIARKLRKSVQHTSTLLKRMTQAGYLKVSPNPEDRRSRLYRIKEEFFDIWLAMSHSRGRRRYLPYLVDFFALWYADPREREAKRGEIQQRLRQPLSELDQEYCHETLAYLSEVGPSQERVEAKLELAVANLSQGDGKGGTRWLAKLPKIPSAPLLLAWMQGQAQQWATDGLEPDIRQRMEHMIEYWREQRSGNLETTARLAHELGMDLSGAGLHRINIALQNELLQRVERPKQRFTPLQDRLYSEKMDGKYQDALATACELRDLAISIGDRNREAVQLNAIGVVHLSLSNYDTALNYLKQSLAIRQEIGDKSGKGVTLNNMATTAYARGDYDTALNYLKQSLTIRQEIGDKSGEGTTLNNMATTAHARGDYDTALSYLKQSLAIQQEIGNKFGEGVTLNNISQVFQARGDYDTALNYLKQSLAIQQEIGDKAGEGTTLSNISQVFQSRGDYDTALNYLKQSLAIQQEIGNKFGEGVTLNNISQVFQARGDYDTALNYLKQSLTIRQEIGDKSGEGATLNNIALVFQVRGDYDTALNYLKQSLAIQQEIGDKSGEGTTLNNISQVFQARGDYDTALSYLKQSLTIRQEIGDKSGEDVTLNNIAQVFQARGDYDTALNYLKQSLTIRQEIGDVAGLCTTLFNIGHIHLQNEEFQKAVSAWVQVYRLAKPMQLTQVLDALAHLADQMGLPGGMQGWGKLVEQIGDD